MHHISQSIDPEELLTDHAHQDIELIGVRTVAQAIGIGKNTLLKWMREHQLILANNRPTPQSVTDGLMRCAVGHHRARGKMVEHFKPLLTPMGAELVKSRYRETLNKYEHEITIDAKNTDDAINQVTLKLRRRPKIGRARITIQYNNEVTQ